MTWLEYLDHWRISLTEMMARDGEGPPTEEELLRQVIHNALSGYLPGADISDDWENAIDAWVDHPTNLSGWRDSPIASPDTPV